MDETSLQSSCKIIWEKKTIDVLIYVVGDNELGTIIREYQAIYYLPIVDFKSAVDLDLFESVFPSMIFGMEMTSHRRNVIIKIFSMTAQSSITRVVGFSASKATIDNFIKGLSVELVLKYGEGLSGKASIGMVFKNRIWMVRICSNFTFLVVYTRNS